MSPGARPPSDDGTQHLRQDLPHDDSAPGLARALVRDALTRWDLVDRISDAELAISELVTNAVRHGLPPIVLEIGRTADSLRIAISDGRPSTAHHDVRIASCDDDESGRGQGIIEAVSDHTGVDETAVAGKSIYATWDVSAPDHA